LRDLKFEQEPNYTFLRLSLKEIGLLRKILYDNVFEWASLK